jgi:hypothetical protein
LTAQVRRTVTPSLVSDKTLNTMRGARSSQLSALTPMVMSLRELADSLCSD